MFRCSTPISKKNGHCKKNSFESSAFANCLNESNDKTSNSFFETSTNLPYRNESRQQQFKSSKVSKI